MKRGLRSSLLLGAASAARSAAGSRAREVSRQRALVRLWGRLGSIRPLGGLGREDLEAPGPGGPVPMRLYRPAAALPRAAVLFAHGGGFVTGGIEDYDRLARDLCRVSGLLVASVDYRLAPEHPFPAAVEDEVAAYERLLALVGDGARIVAMGDSAGGCLAAALCAEARDRGLTPPAGQVLFYPVTDLSSFDTESYRLYADSYLLRREDMEWYRSLYLPREADWRDPRASPLLRKDLSGLPPALVVTAELDVLRDEGEAYARALSEAGVPTSLRRFEGVMHGFASMGRLVPESLEAVRLAGLFAREAAGAAGRSPLDTPSC
jgi:acetyl esterase